MDVEKYNRSIALACPTCGDTQFNPSEPDSGESALHTCITCGREITHDELMRENSENINEHIKEIGKEVTEDLKHEIKKKLSGAFKDSKYIKIK